MGTHKNTYTQIHTHNFNQSNHIQPIQTQLNSTRANLNSTQINPIKVKSTQPTKPIQLTHPTHSTNSFTKLFHQAKLIRLNSAQPSYPMQSIQQLKKSHKP